MHSVPLKLRTGVTWKDEGTSDWLTEGCSESGGDVGVVSLVPEWRLAEHGGHKINLGKTIKCLKR